MVVTSRVLVLMVTFDKQTHAAPLGATRDGPQSDSHLMSSRQSIEGNMKAFSIHLNSYYIQTS